MAALAAPRGSNKTSWHTDLTIGPKVGQIDPKLAKMYEKLIWKCPGYNQFRVNPTHFWPVPGIPVVGTQVRDRWDTWPQTDRWYLYLITSLVSTIYPYLITQLNTKWQSDKPLTLHWRTIHRKTQACQCWPQIRSVDPKLEISVSFWHQFEYTLARFYPQMRQICDF